MMRFRRQMFTAGLETYFFYFSWSWLQSKIGQGHTQPNDHFPQISPKT